MTSMNLLDSELDTELRDTVESLMAKVCDPSRLVAMYDGDRSIGSELWDKIRHELGLAGVLIPEELGGVGLTSREAAVVMETLGRHVTATPFLTSAVVATSFLLALRSPMVAELASGQITAALAVPLPTGPMGPVPTFALAAEGKISGLVSSVAGAIDADMLLLPVDMGNGRIAVYAVPASEVSITPRISLDMTRQVADLSCQNAVGVLVTEDAGEILRGALMTGAVLLASEQAGIASWCLDTSVAYLKERRQFGQALGGFQALKHRLADLYVKVENARSAARFAAAALAENDPEVEIAAAVAQAFCSDVAVLAAEEAVQLHAGMGMTWEHPAHLYLKRAKADQVAFGTAGEYRAWLAELVDIPAAAARTASVVAR